MIFMFDPRDKTPIYEQMVRQLRRQIAMGLLQPGEALPSVRQVSGEMGVNPNTVQKAYRMMEAEGLTVSVPGKGSFVTDRMDEQRQKQKAAALSVLRGHLSAAREAGMSLAEAEAVLKEVFKEE